MKTSSIQAAHNSFPTRADARKRVRALPLLLSLAVISCAGLGTSAPPGHRYQFVEYPIRKIRPEAFPVPGAKTTMHAAGNEYEPVMFGVANPGTDELLIAAVRVSAQFDFELFFVSYYDAKERTRLFDPCDTSGRWPDPLVPIPGKRTAGADETILSFAFNGGLRIPARENRHFLLDTHLPAGSRSNRIATIELELSDGTVFPYEIELRPYAFDLPRDSAIATSANLHVASMLAQHRLEPGTDAAIRMEKDYRELLARHRVFPYYPNSLSIPNTAGPHEKPVFDFGAFDAEAGPTLDGTAFPGAPRTTSFFAPDPSDVVFGTPAHAEYLRQLEGHMKEKGWLDRMFYFLADEPFYPQYFDIIERVAFIKAVAPDIRTMITDPYSDGMANVVDIFCPDVFGLGDAVPLLPFFFSRGLPAPEWQIQYDPSVYRRRMLAGGQNWLYSCNSAQLLDQPNVFIDSRASYQRVIPWLMFSYGFEGFLYWNVGYNYYYNGDPWTNQFNIHSQGDGNLMYPGKKGMFWLEGETPVPSLRLKLLREGFEDFEYLSMLERMGFPPEAGRLSRRVSRSTLSWERDEEAIQEVRHAVATAIEASSAR